MALPVNNHSGLRKRKGQEGADGIERNEPVGNAAKDDEQHTGKRDEDINAPGVKQTATTKHENMRQVVVERDGAGKAGKVGKGGVGDRKSTRLNSSHRCIS